MVFPDQWRPIVVRAISQWHVLTPEEQARMEATVWMLVNGKRWEAAHGFELSDEIEVTIAAQASLLVLGLDAEAAYDDVGTILVHPTTVQLHGERSGPALGTRTDDVFPVLGLAQHDGPVVIAWDEVLRNTRHPERGHNVVYHEFAHKLDMADGLSDGTPILPTKEAMQRWVEVCTAEYQKMRAGEDDGFLDAYATVNPAEFFAVVTEVFFDTPVEMEQRRAELYEVLRDFYNQDPAARVRLHKSEPA
jgi:Mlc titration factor MtfA (ptsG expression regulator)